MKKPFYVNKNMQQTVDNLCKQLQELSKKGYGAHPIFVANDDEGNGVHAIAYSAQVGYVKHGAWDTDQYAYDEKQLFTPNNDEVVIIG